MNIANSYHLIMDDGKECIFNEVKTRNSENCIEQNYLSDKNI